MFRAVSKLQLVCMLCMIACCLTFSQARADTPLLTGTVHPFGGVPWGSKPETIKSMLQAQGYTFEKIDSDGDLDFDGNVNGVEAKLYAYLTPEHRLVKTQVSCVTPDDDAIDFYHTLRDSLTVKYGDPSSNFEFYSDPYSDTDSDSDKATAISVGDGQLAAFWAYTDGSAMYVEVTKALNVNVSYESVGWPKELDRRKAAGISSF